jgi:ABC-type maltose transport system permease subunit
MTTQQRSGNGNDPCVVNCPIIDEISDYRAEVIVLSSRLGDFSNHLKKFEEVPSTVAILRNQVLELIENVTKINEWRTDNAALRIRDLEQELKDKANEVERDKMDFRRSVRSALVTALMTLVFITVPATVAAYHLARMNHSQAVATGGK